MTKDKKSDLSCCIHPDVLRRRNDANVSPPEVAHDTVQHCGRSRHRSSKCRMAPNIIQLIANTSPWKYCLADKKRKGNMTASLWTFQVKRKQIHSYNTNFYCLNFCLLYSSLCSASKQHHSIQGWLVQCTQRPWCGNPRTPPVLWMFHMVPKEKFSISHLVFKSKALNLYFSVYLEMD